MSELQDLLRECSAAVETETYDRELVKRITAAIDAQNVGDKLALLLSKCKCSVTLTVNDHRDVYQTAAQRLEERREDAAMGCCPYDIPSDPAIIAEMIRTNTIVELQFYPNTPIGFYAVVHYDLNAALDQALSVFAE